LLDFNDFENPILALAAEMQSPMEGLPPGITSRMMPINDLNMHILEAGNNDRRPRSLIILLHGFPELAFSWRKVLVPLSELGYHVVAPDQRGFGRTTSRTGITGQIHYEDDVHPFNTINLVRDVVALAFALGHKTVAAVIGHDLGSRIAACCALIRPDIFRSVVLMSSPFSGPPSLPFDIDPRGPPEPSLDIFSREVQEQLAALDPPRKYYKLYYATPDANRDFMDAPQGLHAFLRAYFHMKSADWPGNDPRPLSSPAPANMAKLPHYYMMPLDSTMPEAVAPHAPSEEEITRNEWLTNSELAVYTAEYERTGFQGGFNWYRTYQPEYSEELAVFSGKKIQVPGIFVSGIKDWGAFQTPGALQKMQSEAFSRMREGDVLLIEGAGHWVQQEQPDQLVDVIKKFLEEFVH